MMKATSSLFLLVWAVFMLASCGALMPTQKANTLEERLGVASMELSGIKNVHASLIESGRVTPQVDADLVKLEKTVGDAIFAGREALKLGDLTKAEGQLGAMKAALDVLNRRIAQLEGAK